MSKSNRDPSEKSRFRAKRGLFVEGDSTLTGNLSVGGEIYFPDGTTQSGSNANQASVYSTVNAASADWQDVYTDVSTTSADWNSTYSNSNANSARWEDVYTDVAGASADWNSTYSNSNANSGRWEDVYTDVAGASADWNSVYSSVCAASASWSSSSNNVSGTDENTNLEDMYTYAHANYFNELLYSVTDVLTSIQVYQDATKALQLFSRELEYDTTYTTLTAVTTTDLSNNNTLIKTYTYNIATGTLENVTRQYNIT